MKSIPPPTARSLRPWQNLLFVLVVLVIFGGALGLLAYTLRSMLVKQVLRRESESLQSVVLMHMDEVAESGSPLSNPENQLMVALKTSRLKGVMGAYIFNESGEYVIGFPTGLLSPIFIEAQQITGLKGPHAELRRFDSLAQLFESTPGNQEGKKVPVLFVSTVLKTSEEASSRGTAVFLSEGQTMAEEVSLLTRRLVAFSGSVFGIGGTFISFFLLQAFQKQQRLNAALQKEQESLSAKTAELIQLNHELTLLAKTSALGSVTANLLHGLQSPLHVLRHFVQTDSKEATNLDWTPCIEAVQKMRELIHEVLKTITEDRELINYRLTCSELLETLNNRVSTLAGRREVVFKIMGSAPVSFSNNQAHLILMILQNLAENAVEASEKGQSVLIHVAHQEKLLSFLVEDQGPGLASSSLKNLFRPTSSTKPNGSGLGLVISNQLARHLGGEIVLRKSDATGALFAFSLPLAVISSSQEKLIRQSEKV